MKINIKKIQNNRENNDTWQENVEDLDGEKGNKENLKNDEISN